MSTSAATPVRRAVSALAAATLALAGLLVATGPASAAGPELVIDDFSAAPLGTRSIAGNASSVNVTGGGAQVSISAANGTPYAEIRWTFSGEVDLTQGGVMHQLQMDYAGAWGDPNAGNPIMMGIYVETATGTMSRGGTGLFAGSGKFVANYTKQGDDDYRYLMGTGNLTRVRSIYVQFLSSSNTKAAGITVDRLAAVGSEDAYSSPSFTGPTSLTLQPGQAGSATVTVAGYPAPTITTSGSLPPGMSATVSGREVAITGTPTATGTYALTVHAATLSWLTGTHTLTVTVFRPPTLTGSSTLRAELGASFTHTLTVGGDPLPTSASFTQALPPGLTAAVSGTTLTISGTPTGTPGPYPTRVTVANAYASASLDLDLQVAGPATIAAVPATLTGVDVPMTPIDVALGGFPIPTVTSTGLPPGVTVTTTATGVRLGGTPTTGGVFPVTLTAANGVGTPATSSFVLTVGTAPELTVDDTVAARVGVALDVPVVVSGLPAATVTATDLPDGVTVVDAGSGAWALRGTPTRAGMGERTATVTATNAVGHDDATVAFAVAGAPELTVPASVEATVGTPVDISVSATGYPVPALAATNLPAGLSATDDGAGHLRIQGTPTVSGTRAVEITGTNAEGTDTAALSIEVGTAPVFDDGDTLTLTVREGTAVSHTVPVSSYPSHTVALASGTLPAGLTLGTDGTLSGTPAAGTADAGSGRYEVVLQASNRSGSDDLAVTILVLSPPTTDLPDTVTIASDDAAAEVVFHTGGWDRPSVTVTGLPAGLALTQVDTTTWRLSGAVARADRGRHDVTVTVENAFGRSSRIVRLDVTAPFAWDPAPAEVLVETGVAMAPVTLRGTGYPMPFGYSLGGLEGWISWVPSWDATSFTMVYSGTPSTAGVRSLSLTPLTAGDPPVAVAVRVVDRPVIDAPAALDVVAGQEVDQLVTVSGSPSAALTAGGLPDGLSLVAGAAEGEWRITGTPTRAGAGVHEVTLTADNGIAVTRTLTVTVGAAPQAALATYTQTTEIGRLVGVGFLVTGYPQPTITVDGMPPGIPERVEDGWVYVWGTPTQAGTFTTTIRIANAHGSLESVVTTVVHQEPAFAEDALDLALIEGVEGSLSLPLVGYPAPTVTMTGEVPGMTLTHTPGTDPVLSGTPAPGSAGTYVLDVTASNTVVGSPRSATARIAVRVDARAAITAGADALAAAVGTPVDRPVQVAGSPVPALTATGLPDGLALVAGDAPGEFRITGTPAVGSGGLYTAHLVAENGVLDPAAADVAVEVTEPVRLAAGLDGTAALREGAPTRVGVATSGGWPTAVTLRVEGTLPTGLTFVDDGDGTGHVVGTPTAGTAGRWSVVVAADNGAAVTRTPLVLDVAAAPAPVRPATPGTRTGGTATVPVGDDPAPATTDDDAADDATGTDDGTDDGSDGAADDEAGADDDAQAAPPVLDPEETIRTESGRPWWWILGAVLVGAVLLGLRTVERKLRSL